MTDFDITKTSDKDLCEAGGRLQQAHDYVEEHYFRIQSYEPTGLHGACCYIGSVKHVAGESCGPTPTAPSQVGAALRIMDSVAVENGALPEGYGRKYAGGLVEGWALEGGARDEFYTSDGMRKNDIDQAKEALPIFRQAIREVQKEMDRRAS